MRSTFHRPSRSPPAIATRGVTLPPPVVAPGRTAAPPRTARHDIHDIPIAPVQRVMAHPTLPNRTGMSDALKAGVEALSGMSLESVRVHRNSPRPGRIDASAYTQGTNIYLAPGQERHLPHEAWHVVQQSQGRVRSTGEAPGGIPLNDDAELEQEADRMGTSAAAGRGHDMPAQPAALPASNVVQCVREGNEEEGDQIKICDEDGDNIETVYFVEEKRGRVYYRRTKGKSKSKGGDLSISPLQVFPARYTNQQIQREIKLGAEAEEAIDSDDLPISRKMLEAILTMVEAYVDKNHIDLSVQLNIGRIVFALQESSDLRDLLKDASVEELPGLLTDDYGLADIAEAQGRTGTATVRSTGGQGSGEGSGKVEWKSEHTKRAKAQLLERLSSSRDAALAVAKQILIRSTLHHKVSRSHLGRLYALYRQTPGGTPGIDDMARFLDRLRNLTNKGDPEQALDNWLANIELGPKSEDRAERDDPGDEFDGSYPGGRATPRTELLQEVDLIINPAVKGTDVPWRKVAYYLQQTQNWHEQRADGNAFSLPNLGQWQGSAGSYVRDEKGASGQGGKSSQSSGKSRASASSGARDIVKWQGRRYSPTVENVRDLGQCLWDTLRARGLGAAVDQLAQNPSNRVDQAVDLDDLERIATRLSVAAQAGYGIHITLINIFTLKVVEERTFGEGQNMIYIGMFYDPNSGLGHYTPALD